MPQNDKTVSDLFLHCLLMFYQMSKGIWVKGIFKLCFRYLKMVKRSPISVCTDKKAVIVSPFKRYETELPMNGCSLFKSPWHIHRRIIKSPVKAPTFSPYKSPLIAVRYSPKQTLMRNKNCKTSAKSLFQSQEANVSPIEENDAAWEKIETIESGTEDTQYDNSIHSVTNTATANNLETSNESIKNEMTNMLPNVFNELSEYGLETDLPAILQLVCENRFPFSNIAFQLGIEIEAGIDRTQVQP